MTSDDQLTFLSIGSYLMLLLLLFLTFLVLNLLGAYVKMPMAADDLELSKLNSDTRYSIMFGPDKCGTDNKVHFILQHKNPVSNVWEEKHFNTTIPIKGDKRKTHLYTLHIKNNNDFEIYIDMKSASKGNLLTHMKPSINPNEEIDDETDKQPEGVTNPNCNHHLRIRTD